MPQRCPQNDPGSLAADPNSTPRNVFRTSIDYASGVVHIYSFARIRSHAPHVIHWSQCDASSPPELCFNPIRLTGRQAGKYGLYRVDGVFRRGRMGEW